MKATQSMSSPYSAITSSPLGKLGLIVQDGKLIKLEFLSADIPLHSPNDKWSKQWVAELQHYFTHPKHCFQLAIHLDGTAFQQRVWHALQHIASGAALTYGQLAKKLQTAPRAIGQACRTNPLPIIIPCHRIVATHHLGGYAGNINGRFKDIKTWLLRHEGYQI